MYIYNRDFGNLNLDSQDCIEAEICLQSNNNTQGACAIFNKEQQINVSLNVADRDFPGPTSQGTGQGPAGPPAQVAPRPKNPVEEAAVHRRGRTAKGRRATAA